MLTFLIALLSGGAGACRPPSPVPSIPYSLVARPSPPPEVLDYELTLDLPDTGRVIDARAVLTVRRTAPGLADTLTLDLVALHVDSVLVNGASTPVVRDPETLRIPLPPPSRSQAPESSTTLTVTVRYGGLVSDGLIVHPDSVGHPWTAFGDNWPNRARFWIPSQDHPSHKATVTWIVRAPSNRRVVANGELLEETPLSAPSSGAQPRTLTRWRESKPIPVYLMVIAAAPLAYYDLGASACGRAESGGCVRQSVYVAPEVRDFLPGPFAHVGEIVDLFTRLVAPFPYEKLAHIESATRFGGMENASAIFYADAPFRRRTMGDAVIAHETAHQWFGDAVTEREWAHLWLSEGFATYFQQLWVEHSQGDTAFRHGMAALRDQIIADTAVTLTRPVLDTAETNYLALLNTNSYQKGAWTLHMLRTLVGDSAFFRGIRAYYVAHRHGTALTDDLRRAMEQASSQALGWFFDQWLRRPGYAEVTTSWRYDPRARRVIVDLVQGTRWSPYRFPLTIEIRDADGTSHRATVPITATHTQHLTIPIPLARTPRAVLLDPDVRLLATFSPSRPRGNRQTGNRR